MIEQPFKMPYIAAVVLDANKHKSEVAAEILKRAADFCQGHVEAGNWRQVKLILRFLACLSGLFDDDGVFPILDELFNRTIDLQTASAEDVSFASLYCLSETCIEEKTDAHQPDARPRTGQNHPLHHPLRPCFFGE